MFKFKKGEKKQSVPSEYKRSNDLITQSFTVPTIHEQ